MRIRPTILCTGALLLIAAQDAPQPPTGDVAVAEAESVSQAESAEPAPAVGPAEADEADEADEVGEEVGAQAEPADEEPTAPEPQAEVPDAEPAEAADGGAAAIASEPAPGTADEAAAPDDLPAAVAETDSGVPVPAKGEPPTREFMVGVWTEDLTKCESALDFKADGTLIGPFPGWKLEDGVLTMTGNRQKIWLTVVDKDTMESRRSETDPPRTLLRCP